MDQQLIIEHTQAWIATMVIGLNLCPFARRVFEAGTIRYVVSEAGSEAELLDDLTRELSTLAAASPNAIETTLLIHPNTFADFLDYNDFLAIAEQRLDDLGLTGVIQIASFHPAYQFADTAPDDVENYTNRSPYPMLHLLREDSITQIAGSEEEMMEIPRRNIATLRALGRAKIMEMLRQ